MQERIFRPWLLNLNLQAAVELWQKQPDSKDRLKQMELLLKFGRKAPEMSVKVSKKVLESFSSDDSFIPRTFAEAYGNIDGENIVFVISNGLNIRTGETQGKGYLFFEHKGERGGYCRPDFITEIAVK